MSDADWQFESFKAGIAALPAKGHYAPEDLLTDQFRLVSQGRLEVYYAPFDHIEAGARVVLVGACPGLFQMEVSYRTARAALNGGASNAEALRAAKYAASFGGPTRRNLVRMLDAIGIHSALGLRSTLDLFGPASHLAHPTSAVRFPVFINGKNYTGTTPDLLGTPVLRAFLEKHLTEELAAIPSALIVPLGIAGAQAVAWLVDQGRLDGERCLGGLPHPSGANAGRIAAWLQNPPAAASETARRHLAR